MLIIFQFFSVVWLFKDNILISSVLASFTNF